jgi:hypothetical protein
MRSNADLCRSSGRAERRSAAGFVATHPEKAQAGPAAMVTIISNSSGSTLNTTLHVDSVEQKETEGASAKNYSNRKLISGSSDNYSLCS